MPTPSDARLPHVMYGVRCEQWGEPSAGQRSPLLSATSGRARSPRRRPGTGSTRSRPRPSGRRRRGVRRRLLPRAGRRPRPVPPARRRGRPRPDPSGPGDPGPGATPPDSPTPSGSCSPAVDRGRGRVSVSPMLDQGAPRCRRREPAGIVGEAPHPPVWPRPGPRASRATSWPMKPEAGAAPGGREPLVEGGYCGGESEPARRWGPPRMPARRGEVGHAWERSHPVRLRVTPAVPARRLAIALTEDPSGPVRRDR